MDKWLRKVDHYSPASLFWAGLAVGFTLAFLLGRSSSHHGAPATKEALAQTLPQRLVPTASNPRTPVPGAFWLVVQVTFRRSKDVETFKAAFAPLAALVKENEGGTLSYGLAVSDKDPRMVLIFERYTDKDDAYLRVHRSSEPFQVFRPQLAALKADISGESYIESDLGFV